MHKCLIPGTPAPAIDLPLVGGGQASLRTGNDLRFVMLTFYRGWHCPRCKLHLVDIASKLARFSNLGVDCLAVSMDNAERAERSHEQWGLGQLKVAYELDEPGARTWGLYLTDSIHEREPRRFSEPAVVLVDAKSGTIFSALYGTSPFNRVHAADLLEGLQTIIARDYPPRGTVE